MKPTNKENLPETVVAAIMTDHYTNPNERKADYSITKIISPIQETILSKKYSKGNKLIIHDVLDFFKSWVGSVIHNALEDAWSKDMKSIVEKRYYKKISGKTISGKVDCFDINKSILMDYKTMALYKYQKKDFKQYEQQANLYAMLLREAGHVVNSLEIIAIILDWKKQEAKYKPNYPQAPIVPVKLPLWSEEECFKFALERVCSLEDAKLLSDKELYEVYPCSKEEQWRTDKGWSVHKKDTERATKVFECEKDAGDFIENHKTFTTETHEVRHRFAEPRKCIEYCDCANICQQRRIELMAETGVNPHAPTPF